MSQTILIIVIVLLLQEVYQVDGLKHQRLFSLVLDEHVWRSPERATSVLHSLEQKNRVRFWGVQANGQFVVSFPENNLEPNIQNLIGVKGVTITDFLKRREFTYTNPTLVIYVVTCIDNVSTRDLIKTTLPSEVIVYADSHTGINNALTLRFKSFSVLNSTLVLLLNSRSVLSVEFMHPLSAHTTHALETSIMGNDYLPNPFSVQFPDKFAEGEIITIGDTGIDTSHCYFFHSQHTVPRYRIAKSNFRSLTKEILSNPGKHPKILAYFAIDEKQNGRSTSTDFVDDVDGHGTHVAGAAVPGILEQGCGNKAMANPRITSNAKIIFFDFSSSDRGLENEGLLIPRKLDWIMQTSWDLGSRIFSNSWGSSGSQYSEYSSRIDEFVHNNPEYSVIFSAGNDGPENFTIGSPATMKNGISVGSTLNSYHSFLEYTNSSVWRNYTSMLQKDQVTLFKQYFHETHLSEFSSRGPTLDGRIKPDVVFPGEFVLSARSKGPRNQTPHSDMLLMRGTSMATPLIAAMVSLIEERLKKTYKLSHPTAALKKAIVVSSTRKMSGSSQKMELNRTTGNLFVSTRKNKEKKQSKYDFGFGRFSALEFLSGGFNFEDRIELFSNSNPVVRCFRTKTFSDNSVVTMVYDDVPALPGTKGTVLINDLNLRVIISSENDENGFKNKTVLSVLNGNHGAQEDSLNNVEQVRFVTISGDLIRVVLAPKGQIVSLRRDRIQNIFAALVWSSNLEQVECDTECENWDLPRECQFVNPETNKTMTGRHPCEANTFILHECGVYRDDMRLCQDQNQYTVGYQTNCDHSFPKRQNVPVSTPRRSLLQKASSSFSISIWLVVSLITIVSVNTVVFLHLKTQRSHL